MARGKADIEAEIAAARSRLSSNVEGLVTQVHPDAVKTRSMNDAKDFVAGEAESARAMFVDESGAPRVQRIAYLAVAVVGTVALTIVVKSLFRR